MSLPRRQTPMPRVARLTLRSQLALLYAGFFIAAGSAVLLAPVFTIRQSVPAGASASAMAQINAGTQAQVLRAIAAFAVMAVASLVVGWLIAGRFLRPLRVIIAAARDISASNLHRRLDPGPRDDEFSELSETLNDLIRRLEASFESQRRFVANASHELRTPLSAERALLQVALADPDATAETLRSTCEELLELGEQQERLIGSLLTLASSERGVEHWERFDLADVAGKAILDRQHEAARRRVHIEAALSVAPATGDPSLVESLVANLVDNALRHNVPGGRAEIATAATAGQAVVSVGNTGQLVPPDEVDRLFQPFQRLSGARISHTGGYGLGLAIVRAIAGAHGATITANPRPGGGLDIEVAFPRPGDPGP